VIREFLQWIEGYRNHLAKGHGHDMDFVFFEEGNDVNKIVYLHRQQKKLVYQPWEEVSNGSVTSIEVVYNRFPLGCLDNHRLVYYSVCQEYYCEELLISERDLDIVLYHDNLDVVVIKDEVVIEIAMEDS
jgi:hypothetical protein